MNNSAFKANVHLNIISHSSLFFSLSVDRKKTLLPDYLDSCGSAFCKDANVDGFPFFVFSESTKWHFVDFLWKGPGTSKNIYSWTLPDAPQKSIRQSASLSLSLCGDEAESLYVLFSVWYIHLFPQKLKMPENYALVVVKKRFQGILRIHYHLYTIQYLMHITNRWVWTGARLHILLSPQR